MQHVAASEVQILPTPLTPTRLSEATEEVEREQSIAIFKAFQYVVTRKTIEWSHIDKSL